MLDVIYGPLSLELIFRKLDLIYAAEKLLDVIYGLVNSRTEGLLDFGNMSLRVCKILT